MRDFSRAEWLSRGDSSARELPGVSLVEELDERSSFEVSSKQEAPRLVAMFARRYKDPDCKSG